MRAPPPSARIGATVLERGRRRGATRARGHDGERTSILPDLLIVLGLAAIYFIAGKLGLKLAFVHANATPVWPPTGIAIAASLLLGSRVWPGIFLGAYLVAITTQGSVATSLGIAAGNTLEGVVAGLVNRFARGSSAFDRSQDLLKFVLLAGPLSPIVSATFGVTSLSLGGYASWSQYPSIWFTWWLGDVGGALLVAPLIVIWGRARRRWNRGRLPEAFLALIILVLVGQTVFGGWFPGEVKNYELTYLCLPVLVWMGLRFGLHETALASLLLSQIAIWGTLRGYGPFVRASPNESLLLLQAFTGASAVFALVFAAVVARHGRADEKRKRLLRKLQTALDQIETLEGFLPICAACKRIRNDRGDWEHMELYIERRSEARFTHGICPQCSGEYYR